MAEKVGGDFEWLTLDELRPDWDNPRFLPGASERFEDDADVYTFLDRKYDAYAVADSIARHGFFNSEPLIAIPGESKGIYTVVEGNRRLTALKALTDPDLRQRMTRKGWQELPDEVELPDAYPVLIVESRERVAPILGFRHITGISGWDPYQQARYVAEMIDQEGLSADEVAELVGRSASEVRGFYRNFGIVEQAEDVFGIEDAKRVIDEFGVWTRAMSSAGIRAYISAPAPRNVAERVYPLPDEAEQPLATLIIWIFGVPRSAEDQAEGKQSREGRVISDSRELSRLGKALTHPKARGALERGEMLERAERAMLDSRARFGDSIAAAHDALEDAKPHRPKKLTAGMETTLDEVERIAAELKRDG